MNAKVWTFLAGIALLLVFYGGALLFRSLGDNNLDYKQLVLFGNVVAVGLIGVLGFGAVRNGNGKGKP